MDILGTLLTVIFVAILIGIAFTLGATLLIAIVTFSIITAFVYVARQQLNRFLFVRGVVKRERQQGGEAKVTIIETEYEDITDI